MLNPIDNFRWIKTQIKMLKRKRRRRARQRKSKSIVITASQEEDGEVMEEDDEGKITIHKSFIETSSILDTSRHNTTKV